MADLSTTYMGLELKNPIIVGSSELTNKAKKVKKLADAGAGAVVLKSLFEEQIMMEVDAQRVNNMYGSFNDVEDYVAFYTRKHNLDKYLDLIRESKDSVNIPVIASINCISSSEWVDFATRIESAGADGLELNVFIMPNDPDYDGATLERVYFNIIKNIHQHINVPVALKLGTYFSGLAGTFIDLSKTGISAMVLFNRFYSPDVNLEKEEIRPSDIFSHPHDISTSLRWIGILSDQVECDLSASTGVHDGYAVIKNLLVGAKATHVVSALYQNSESHIATMLEQMESWMDSKGYQSLADFRGKLSQAHVKQPMMYERSQFMRYYSNYGDAKY
jgi:dihydroorotate dehydrogenase (fumarate)